MKYKIYSIIVLVLISVCSCNQNQSANMVMGQKDNNINSSTGSKVFQVWQLDYYPDSILINRSINDNSGWNSTYAYNIQFTTDSCQFIGWHESWWNKLIKIDEKNYKITDGDYQYWELKFESTDKLLMRHTFYKNKHRLKDAIGEFIPYHKVNEVLTLASLDKRIAKEIFAGTYHVLFNDTLNCAKDIVLDSDFGVQGIEGIVSYCFESEIDWDFPIHNAFGFNKKGKNCNNGLSFEFLGDTLLLKDYKLIDKDGDFDHVEISKTRIKMLKMKTTPN